MKYTLKGVLTPGMFSCERVFTTYDVDGQRCQFWIQEHFLADEGIFVTPLEREGDRCLVRFCTSCGIENLVVPVSALSVVDETA